MRFLNANKLELSAQLHRRHTTGTVYVAAARYAQVGKENCSPAKEATGVVFPAIKLEKSVYFCAHNNFKIFILYPRLLWSVVACLAIQIKPKTPKVLQKKHILRSSICKNALASC